MLEMWKKFQKKRKMGNKGFSLVELIIVIAIMAALVAILAPQYIRYVASSRDATLEAAANEVATIAKAEVALGHLTDCTITVQRDASPALSDPDAWTTTDYTWASVVQPVADGTNGNIASYTITVATTAGVTTVSVPSPNAT